MQTKEKKLSKHQRYNAEFKHLRKRIELLESIVLDNYIDNGGVLENVKKNIKKG